MLLLLSLWPLPAPHQDVKLHFASFALKWVRIFCGEFARSASKCWIVELSSANYFGPVTFLPWARIASWACLLANFGFNGQSKHVTRQVYTAAIPVFTLRHFHPTLAPMTEHGHQNLSLMNEKLKFLHIYTRCFLDGTIPIQNNSTPFCSILNYEIFNLKYVEEKGL